jgi:hypothetical protein
MRKVDEAALVAFLKKYWGRSAQVTITTAASPTVVNYQGQIDMPDAEYQDSLHGWLLWGPPWTENSPAFVVSLNLDRYSRCTVRDYGSNGMARLTAAKASLEIDIDPFAQDNEETTGRKRPASKRTPHPKKR